MCFQKVYVTTSRSSNEISNPTFNEGLKKSIKSKTVVEKQSHPAGHFSGKHHHDRQCRWEASGKRGGDWEASRRGRGSLGGGAPADPLSAEWSMSFLTEAALCFQRGCDPELILHLPSQVLETVSICCSVDPPGLITLYYIFYLKSRNMQWPVT